MKVVGNIPIPDNVKRGRKVKYPFQEMEIGDSFEIEMVTPNSVAIARFAASQWGKRHGQKYSVCSYGGTYRCWRTA